ncbi:MAG: hypothetical protein M3Y33_06570 [Actinomycetota bacterium]|nr:hypothetical protein [Actinomycetota bacterium]
MGRLLDLAGADDATRARIGDVIAAVKRGGQLPAVEDVRRRLGLGQEPGSPGVTFGTAGDGWRPSTRRSRRSTPRAGR